MFAILKFGETQYKAIPGEAIIVDNLPIEVGQEGRNTNIALVSNDSSVVTEASELSKYAVVFSVLKKFRDDKILVFKKKRRKGYTRKRGHRQDKTLLLIKEIVKN